MAWIRTPSVDRCADAGPWNIVVCVDVSATWFISERELGCTVVWRDLSSTGQRHHVNRQRFSHVESFVVNLHGQICRLAARRSSCCLPADWRGEPSAWVLMNLVSESTICHGTWKRHAFSSYWRICDYSTCWLRVWNIAVTTMYHCIT